MVTPTGAAIMRALARPAPPAMGMITDRIGYGAGTKDFTDRPNVLRLMIGEREPAYQTDDLIEIQANIDDLNPQIYDHLVERIFAAGARDVTLTPTIMKKGRPAMTVAILAEPADRERIAAVVFAETTTIGLRYHPVSRLKLAREIIEVDTRWGRVRAKVSRGGETLTVTPEYEDCKRLARDHHVPLRVVLDEAQSAARRRIQ